MTTASLQSLVTLPIDSIRASATNPRQHFDPAGLTELSASIAEVGVQVPLLVRPMHDPDDGEVLIYEIVDGERRFGAAAQLGLVEVPCLVRELTDEETREAQIIANLQRADVHPVEEATAFGELLGRLGTITAVAVKVSKGLAYVAKCLRLLSLTLHSRDALRGGLITIDHALLLARLAETEQNAALKWTLDRNAGSKTTVDKVVADRLARVKAQEEERKDSGSRFAYVWEPESVVRLKGHIQDGSGIDLARAPWKPEEEDNLLPDVVGCSECDKNTKANAPLFGDLDIEAATCTDGVCFAAKTAGFVHLAQLAAGHGDAKNPQVPRLSWKYSSVKPSIVPNTFAAQGGAEQTANPAKVLKQGQWVEAKKGSCPNVRPGVTADWSDSGDRGYMGGGKKLRKPGETLLVCIAVGCKVHRKDYEKAKSSDGNHAQKHDPAEEMRAREEQEFVEKEETKIREKVFAAVLRRLDVGKVLRLIADNEHEMPAIRKELLKGFPGVSGDLLEALGIFVSQFRYSICDVNGYWLMKQKDGVASDRKSTWTLAKKVGVNADEIAAKHFHDAGSIAPAADRLYPKGIAWPKKEKAGTPAAKPSAKAKPVAKPTVKPAVKKAVVKKKPAVAAKAAKKKAAKAK